MFYQCWLETEGYRVLFDFKTLSNQPNYLDLNLEFYLDFFGSQTIIKSSPSFIAISDLQRLINYFKEHIIHLRQDPETESYLFTPLELGFQIQALSGEIRDKDDGEFSLRFMINMNANSDNSSSYFGGESVIYLKNLKNFINSLSKI
jgi:hypothetical protein